MTRTIPTASLLLAALAALAAAEPASHLARFGAGDGPVRTERGFRLLDEARTPLQSNAVAFDRAHEGARGSASFACRLRVLEGGEGGAVVFLNTAESGARGPAPFVRSWVEPDLRGTFAVGIDVHDPPTREPFGPDGNILGRPEREVSLHWDGREIVKRVAPVEFRGRFVDLSIGVRHVCGGAEVTVTIAGAKVYDRFFVADLLPYESRLAIGAGTRADATTAFDVEDVRFVAGAPARPRRPPVRVELFHHVMTDGGHTSYETEVDLPPASWAFGRVILTLEIHDGGKMWDEWDRNGHLSVSDGDGVMRDIVPFITSYRTPWRWQVDVTHFRPWLSGKRRFRIAAGTTFYRNRGFLMSASLAFHHGTPAREAFSIVPLWVGTARYGSDERPFGEFFEPRTVAIPAEATGARIFTTTTGHSQVGEFTPSRRTIVFAPERGGDPAAARRFENVLWKTDCGLNPNRPQFGTWKYPRAGWAPGDVVRPWWIDLTPDLVPGATAELRYEPRPYEFPEDQRPEPEEIAKATHVVRSYLVLERAPTGLVAAPVVRIAGVADGSPAARAGVRAGDWLIRYDGRPVDSADDLRAAIAAAAEAGRETVAVTLLRGAEEVEVEMPAGRMGVSIDRR